MSGIKVVIDPYVALSILDHHQRRGDEEEQVRGLLLGAKVKGMLRITNFVPTLADAELLDLTLRCCPGDTVLGWYATEPTLASEADRATGMPLFVGVHLPSEANPTIAVRAYQVDKLSIAGNVVRAFREAACEIAATSTPSAVAVDTIVRQLCPDVADASDPAAVPSVSSSISNANSSSSNNNAARESAFAEFQQLRRNLKQAQLYCAQAAEGKFNADAGFGRKLSWALQTDLNTLALSPNLDSDIEQTAQDSLMLSYIMKLLAQKVAKLRQNYHETLEDLVDTTPPDADKANEESATVTKPQEQKQ